MTTREQWSREFASALGNANPTTSTLNWISAWTAKEGTKARFNPLATKYDLKPNTNFNSVGVKSYESRAQGIDASVRTLRGDHAGYADIIKGIVQNDPQTAANGLKAAPWGTNGTAVETLWKTTDVRSQQLESESGSSTPSQGVFPRPSPPTSEISTVNPIGPEAANRETYTSPYTDGELSNGVRSVYVIGGVLMVVVSILLAIKTYVPITQVVKTVAAVA